MPNVNIRDAMIANLPPANPDEEKCASCGRTWWDHSGIRCCYKSGSVWRDAKPSGPYGLALDRLRMLYNLGGRPEIPADIAQADAGSPARMLNAATALAEMEVTIKRQEAEIETLKDQRDANNDEVRRLDKRLRKERRERDELERRLDSSPTTVGVAPSPSPLEGPVEPRRYRFTDSWAEIMRALYDYLPPRFLLDDAETPRFLVQSDPSLF